ncbi:MAG: GFA family protein [Paracoccaceae bacterium]
MVNKTGRCMCGAVSFTASDVPTEFSSCYCKTCLRWVGNAYKGVNVPTENIVFTGSENIRTFASSAFAERANCSKCGSAIWWKLTAGPYVGKTSLSLGLLDDTDGMVLTSELFVDCKNSTDEVPEGISQMTSEEAAKIVADFV